MIHPVERSRNHDRDRNMGQTKSTDESSSSTWSNSHQVDLLSSTKERRRLCQQGDDDGLLLDMGEEDLGGYVTNFMNRAGEFTTFMSGFLGSCPANQIEGPCLSMIFYPKWSA